MSPVAKGCIIPMTKVWQRSNPTQIHLYIKSTKPLGRWGFPTQGILPCSQKLIIGGTSTRSRTLDQCFMTFLYLPYNWVVSKTLAYFLLVFRNFRLQHVPKSNRNYIPVPVRGPEPLGAHAFFYIFHTLKNADSIPKPRPLPLHQFILDANQIINWRKHAKHAKHNFDVRWGDSWFLKGWKFILILNSLFFLGSSGVLSVRLRRQQRVCNHKDTVLSPTLATQSPTPNTMGKDINQPNKPLGLGDQNLRKESPIFHPFLV